MKNYPAPDHITARKLLARHLASLAANYADTLAEHYRGSTDAFESYGVAAFTEGIREVFRELTETALTDSRAQEVINWLADDYGEGQDRENSRASMERYTARVRRLAEDSYGGEYTARQYV